MKETEEEQIMSTEVNKIISRIGTLVKKWSYFIMGKFKGGQGKANRPRKKKKIHTAVKFDADDRSSYLNSYIGAKKRRKEHWEMRKQQQER